MLELRNAVIGYQRPVIGPLSFRLQAGETVGLFGPNGCGKSSLLKQFTHQANLISGEIHFDASRGITYQPQQPRDDHQAPLSGADYLALMAADQPAPKPLQPLLTQRIDRLSGGQFQLLSLWANLAAPADLALLDEPTNNLDPQAISILVQWLGERSSQRSALIVSHEREFLQQACDRIIELPGPRS